MKKNEKIMKSDATVYDLSKIILDDELYINTKKDIVAILNSDFKRRKEIVKVIIDEETTIELKLAGLLTNLILFNTFNKFKFNVTQDFIFNTSIFNKKSLSNYFNKIISYFSEENYQDLNNSISEIIEEFADLSGTFNVQIGNTISVYSIIKLSERNERFNEIISTTIPSGLQFNEIEDLIKDLTSEVSKILMNDKDNVFFPYLNSGTGINIKQLSQTIINIGLKPNLDGEVISEAINTNYLRGLRNPQDFYINATGARKAIITNFNKVKESGYLTRKLSLLMIDTHLDYDLDDCGSQHYINVLINNKDILNRLEGRWYFENDQLNLIDVNNEELIGKTVKLRSPITCCNTKGICRTCYGDNLAKLNKELHIGLLSVLILTNQLTQRLLSAKHLLQTRSKKINWQPEFNEYFSVDRNMVLLNNISNANLIIDGNDIKEDEENNYLSINTFKIKNPKAEPITINTDIDLILTEETTEIFNEHKMDDGTYKIPLRLLNPDSVVFNIIMENNELSASLQNILELIETNSHLGLTDIHEILCKFLNLLNESEISINSVHIELILRSLIRSSSNLIQPPDFSQDIFPDYSVLRVSEALIKNPSITISFAFEQIKKQLSLPSTYEKTGISLVDELL